MRLPVTTNSLDVQIVNEKDQQKESSSWNWWNKLRTLCEENSRLGIALEVTQDLPESELELDRWYSEPVRAVIIPTSLFLTNKNGFPVLSKAHQKFVFKFMKVCFCFCVCVSRSPGLKFEFK